MKWYAATITLLALGAAHAAGDAITDARITARIETMFLLNDHLSPLNIITRTSGGAVSLSGSVSDEVQRDLAEQLAASVDGVRSVDNQLVVVQAYVPPSQPRPFWRRVEDLNISASIRRRLLSQGELKGLKIGVDVQRGEVTLYGVVGTEEQRARIAQIASQTDGVGRVQNNLIVQPKAPLDQVQNVGRQISDEWTEKRLETQLLLNRHVRVRNLNIEVDDGVCVLSGFVDTPAQRDLALSLAENIYGLGRVRNEIHVRADNQELLTQPAPQPAVSQEPLEEPQSSGISQGMEFLEPETE